MIHHSWNDPEKRYWQKEFEAYVELQKDELGMSGFHASVDKSYPKEHVYKSLLKAMEAHDNGELENLSDK